eukprot:gene5511-2447_t
MLCKLRDAQWSASSSVTINCQLHSYDCEALRRLMVDSTTPTEARRLYTQTPLRCGGDIVSTGSSSHNLNAASHPQTYSSTLE